MVKKPANQDLRRQVNRRIRQIKKIAKFVMKTVHQYGKRRKGGRSSEGERIFCLGDLIFTAHLLEDMHDGNFVSITHLSRSEAFFQLEWKTNIDEFQKWKLVWDAEGDAWLAEIEQLMEKGGVEKRLSAEARDAQIRQRKLARAQAETQEYQALARQARYLGILVDQ